MRNYWLNTHKNVEEIKTTLETQIQRYLFEPLDDLSKKKTEKRICRLLHEVWTDVEKTTELQLN